MRTPDSMPSDSAAIPGASEGRLRTRAVRDLTHPESFPGCPGGSSAGRPRSRPRTRRRGEGSRPAPAAPGSSASRQRGEKFRRPNTRSRAITAATRTPPRTATTVNHLGRCSVPRRVRQARQIPFPPSTDPSDPGQGHKRRRGPTTTARQSRRWKAAFMVLRQTRTRTRHSENDSSTAAEKRAAGSSVLDVKSAPRARQPAKRHKQGDRQQGGPAPGNGSTPSDLHHH